MAKLPPLKTRREARDFWDTHDLTDYLEELEPVRAETFTLPKSEQQIISIRMERRLVQLLKRLATERGLAYSALVRNWILERLRQELKQEKS